MQLVAVRKSGAPKKGGPAEGVFQMERCVVCGVDEKRRQNAPCSCHRAAAKYAKKRGEKVTAQQSAKAMRHRVPPASNANMVRRSLGHPQAALVRKQALNEVAHRASSGGQKSGRTGSEAWRLNSTASHPVEQQVISASAKAACDGEDDNSRRQSAVSRQKATASRRNDPSD